MAEEKELFELVRQVTNALAESNRQQAITNTRLEGVTKSHESLSDKVDTLNGKVSLLALRGCARGEDHEKQIAELKGRPERTLATLVAVATIVGVVTSIVFSMIQHERETNNGASSYQVRHGNGEK